MNNIRMVKNWSSLDKSESTRQCFWLTKAFASTLTTEICSSVWSVYAQGPKPPVKQTAFTGETLSINTVTMILVNFVFAKICCYLKVNIFHRRIITQLRIMLRSSRGKPEFSFNGFTGLEDCQQWQSANPDCLLGWMRDTLTISYPTAVPKSMISGLLRKQLVFYPLKLYSRYLSDLIQIPLSFETVTGRPTLIRQSKDQCLHPTAHPTILLTHETCSNAQTHMYSHLWSRNSYFNETAFLHRSLRKSTKRNKYKLWTCKLSRSTSAILQATL